jgi:integrase
VSRADRHKPVVSRATRALDNWLIAADITTGPIFRRVRRGGVIAEGLSAEAVRRIVQRRAAQAGLQGNFAAHSLRSRASLLKLAAKGCHWASPWP